MLWKLLRFLSFPQCFQKEPRMKCLTKAPRVTPLVISNWWTLVAAPIQEVLWVYFILWFSRATFKWKANQSFIHTQFTISIQSYTVGVRRHWQEATKLLCTNRSHISMHCYKLLHTAHLTIRLTTHSMACPLRDPNALCLLSCHKLELKVKIH